MDSRLYLVARREDDPTLTLAQPVEPATVETVTRAIERLGPHLSWGFTWTCELRNHYGQIIPTAE